MRAALAEKGNIEQCQVIGCANDMVVPRSITAQQPAGLGDGARRGSPNFEHSIVF